MRVILSVLVDVIRLLALILALASALAALAAVGGAFSNWLDVLTHFAPVYFAGGLVALATRLAAGGGGRLTLIAAGVAILAAGALMAPELLAALRPPPAAGPGPTLKLVQFNLWGGNGDPAGTARWIAAEDADIVVLEEAFGRTRSIRETLRTRYPYQTTCSPPYLCSTLILSKRKPSRLGGMESPGSAARLSGAWTAFDDWDGGFTVVGAHYTWPVPPGPQQAQTRRLARALEEFDTRSLIVSGDFNLTPWSFSLRRQDALFGLERRTRALFSWPAAAISRWRLLAPFPFLAIDQVYAGADWRTVSVRRGPRLGSDHYPVVVVLRREAVAAPPSTN